MYTDTEHNWSLRTPVKYYVKQLINIEAWKLSIK